MNDAPTESVVRLILTMIREKMERYNRVPGFSSGQEC